MPTSERRLIGRAGGETPPDLRSGAGRPRRLPDDLLRQASQRLEILALIAAVLWTLGSVLGHFVLYLTSPENPRWAHLQTIDWIAAGCVAASLALYLFLRRGTLAAERPELRVLFMSGYTDDDIVRRGLLRPGSPFLQKPFMPEELSRKVREVLGGR